MLENYETILEPDEDCEILRIGQSECYKILNAGALQGYKVGKTWRIPKENVAAYIRSKTSASVGSELKKKK
ncbi:MAG: helix-turn-helix domain-containing protein [Lachnospiraceae bacterium]|nr:helix-turn-helix domain-containing protein [Lachnospiraceae bacterium]